MKNLDRFGLPIPKTLEEALTLLDNWLGAAAEYANSVDHYRSQRDAFLQVALTDASVANAAEEVVGKGWRNLIEKSP